VNTITGEGLKQVMRDARVVIDLANSPSFGAAGLRSSCHWARRALAKRITDAIA
jgi:hypothetical protein